MLSKIKTIAYNTAVAKGIDETLESKQKPCLDLTDKLLLAQFEYSSVNGSCYI